MEVISLVKEVLSRLPAEMIFSLAVFGGITWFMIKIIGIILRRYEEMSKKYEDLSDKTSKKVDDMVDKLNEANILVERMTLNVTQATNNAERAMQSCSDKECKKGFGYIIDDLRNVIREEVSN